MTLTLKYSLAGIIALLVTCIVFLSFSYSTKASSPAGLGAQVATTSVVAIGTSASLLFATSTNTCAARIISTASTSAMLTFSDNQGKSPTGVFGVYQAASTTVAYDSGLYGCDAVRGLANTPGLITLMETR